MFYGILTFEIANDRLANDGIKNVDFLPALPTWLPPLLGLTNTSIGFMSGEGRGFNMNGRHLES